MAVIPSIEPCSGSDIESRGIVMTLMGVVQNYTGLLIARIFLGVTEAGLFPGVAVSSPFAEQHIFSVLMPRLVLFDHVVLPPRNPASHCVVLLSCLHCRSLQWSSGICNCEDGWCWWIRR